MFSPNLTALIYQAFSWMKSVNESFFAMKSVFHNRNREETYKFREICYQTDVFCRRKPRKVEGICRERQNSTQNIPANNQNRERQ